jgi:hypothetical protein
VSGSGRSRRGQLLQASVPCDDSWRLGYPAVGFQIVAEGTALLSAQSPVSTPHTVGVMTEVRCSDEAEHRRRLERRQRGLGGFSEPTWESVQARRADFDDWHDERLVLDAMARLDDNVRLTLDHLGNVRRRRRIDFASCGGRLARWRSPRA